MCMGVCTHMCEGGTSQDRLGLQTLVSFFPAHFLKPCVARRVAATTSRLSAGWARGCARASAQLPGETQSRVLESRTQRQRCRPAWTAWVVDTSAQGKK